MMQAQTQNWRQAIDGVNVHALGERECLKKLCELGRYPFITGENSYEFVNTLRGRIAEILGINCDIELSPEDLEEILAHLENGKELKEITRHCFGAAS